MVIPVRGIAPCSGSESASYGSPSFLSANQLFALLGVFSLSYDTICINNNKEYIQLFRERLSEKVHATIPKGIVGGFKFTIL